MGRRFQWIFFDFDGTLVGSIPAMYQIYLKFLKKFGKIGTKNEFLEKGYLDYRLKEKVMGTLDVSYTDESGIREAMQKPLTTKIILMPPQIQVIITEDHSGEIRNLQLI